jgi:hypothetical protein
MRGAFLAAAFVLFAGSCFAQTPRVDDSIETIVITNGPDVTKLFDRERLELACKQAKILSDHLRFRKERDLALTSTAGWIVRLSYAAPKTTQNGAALSK